MVKVRNLRAGEFLPAPLLDTGMPKLDPEWTWVITPTENDLPFAIVVCSYAGGWLVLWRLLSVQPLPQGVAPHWFLEAMPEILENAREKGCVGLFSLFADNRPTERKFARMFAQFGKIAPFTGSIGIAAMDAACSLRGKG